MKKEYMSPAMIVSRIVPMQMIAISLMNTSLSESEEVVDNEEDVWARGVLPTLSSSNGQEEW